MKKLVILLALAGLTVSGAAMAQDEGPDSIGLYFDNPADGCFMMNSMDGDAGAVTAHMVISGPTAASCGGIEIIFQLGEGQGAITGTSFVVSAVDIDDRPGGVQAGFAVPVDPSGDCGMIYLGTLNLFAFGFPTEITAGPQEPDNAAINGRAAYLDGENVENIIPLNFAVDMDGEFTDEMGWLTIPLAAWNGDAPIATEDATWSGVKGLFR